MIKEFMLCGLFATGDGLSTSAALRKPHTAEVSPIKNVYLQQGIYTAGCGGGATVIKSKKGRIAWMIANGLVKSYVTYHNLKIAGKK